MNTTTGSHVSRVQLGPFPPAAPSDPGAPHVLRARVDVDASVVEGPLTRVWESIGYDEINWTYTPTGRRLLRKFANLSHGGYHVRPHYVFCSGSGFGIPHWGSGNVYHEDDEGKPYYDFTIVDQAYDAIVGAGHHVLVELGFTPRDLVPPEAAELTVTPSPTVYTSYEAGTWGYPPRDYGRWAGLVEALVRHCLERYGETEVLSWLWELWNEPDINYWRGTPEQFNELYTVTARAVRNVLPNAKVGGPTVTSGGLEFLKGFLDYTSSRNEPLDFISYHTKGCRFPTREYRPIGSRPSERLNPSSTKMLYDLREFNRAIAEYEPYRDLPAIVDECDAAVPAHFGRYDNRNYEFQNTEYYPVFQVKLMKKILDLNASEIVQVQRATSWSFYFEGERFFEGTRSFLTAGGIEKPFLNAYRMLSLLGDERIRATSDAAWSVRALDDTDGSSMPEEVDVLASRAGNGTLTALVWRHIDDQYHTSELETTVNLSLRNLEGRTYRVRHYRVDAEHSNAHTVWRALGSPQDPTGEELAEITARQGLEEFEPARTVEADAGGVSFEISLPLPAASLLSLEPID
ncbi:GH39 family glycosyl hydrolase [Actinopolymorpha singaporensis]|uniref:Xylan 1,4-beta-xylosidase n=1 Tax=Actinopolymorpha singaporensis TaxID=117157 RepID=A0A1H1R4H0_9ACTN|nr:glycoside hydrolase [Actinopolymorpha singaporensis]SDS30657.1 xylan 1,4-beta-xylosidase [Actinopolymorpha singaporensis]